MKKLFLAFLISFVCIQANSQVVINEIYGGGGNSGSLYKNDFIELYNSGSTAVSLAGWSVQYASSNGSTWNVTALNGTIAAGGYYLIQQAAGTGGTQSLPTPDAIGTIGMSGTAGKVVLANITTAQTGACPSNVNIINYVAYGSNTTCTPSGFTPAPSNTNSVQRTSPGVNTNNNAADFATAAPSPTGSTNGDVTAPLITSLSPVNNATGEGLTINAVIRFDENITKGTGNIVLKLTSDNSIIQTIDVTTAAVTVSGVNVTFSSTGLSINTSYYYEIDATAFKDLANNNFAGITGNTTWTYTTGNGTVFGVLNTTYNLDNCISAIPSGFTQYSTVGPQVWACTSFGRNPAQPTGTTSFGGAVQINGFATTNIPNEDWFISPPFDLTATNFPILSFYSRTAFNGSPLVLKVSTNYDGVGDPLNFTWSEVDGKFPLPTSNIWTLSNNIDLTTFKSANTYFAFVYSSTQDDGARWTLDDIRVDNASTAPPASLTTNTNAVQFGYIPVGNSLTKTIVVQSSNLVGNTTVTSSGAFQVSKTNSGFSNSITYTPTELNNTPTSIFIQFSPTLNNKTFNGTLTITTPTVTPIDVAVKGNSIDDANTLEVVNWNVEWFGSTGFGPTNKQLQENNIKTITANIKADVFALVEVVSETRLQAVVDNLNTIFGANTYSYILSPYGSYTNPFESGASPIADAQKHALIYKNSVVTVTGSQALLANNLNSMEDLSNPAYNYFSSGRYPFMVTADVTLAGVTKQVRFVLIHAKANTSPTTTSYNRRKAGSDTLHYTLNTLYPNDNIILLGDFNDDLDQSITAGFTTTSYSAFVNDPSTFTSPTLALSNAGFRSTVGYNDMIDHVAVSNEMQSYYMGNTASVLTEVTSLVSSYGSTTSDHYPIFTRYAYDPAILPVKFISFIAKADGKNVLCTWEIAESFNTKKYEVLRSKDGINWETIGTVTPQFASTLQAKYNFTDINPFSGFNFYRIREVSIDNRFTLSTIEKVRFDAKINFSIFPNPVTTMLQIAIVGETNNTSVINIYDSKMARVKSLTTSQKQITIPTDIWSKGIYIIQIKTGTSVTTKQFVVAH